MSNVKKPYLIISACLLGEGCRYDAVCKRDALASEQRTHADMLRELRERYTLLPVCPEVMGGLTTPRLPCECVGDRVVRCDGADMTEAYERGAWAVVRLCERYGCRVALLKARSPSCGKGRIYDGTFTGRLIEADGVCVRALHALGVSVYTEEAAEALL